MEDVPHLATVKLEPGVPEDYDEDAATTAALELSKAQEDGKWTWQGLEEAIQLSATAGSGHITCHRQSTRIRRRRSLLGRSSCG
jgi:hypothetical protein